MRVTDVVFGALISVAIVAWVGAMAMRFWSADRDVWSIAVSVAWMAAIAACAHLMLALWLLERRR